MELGRELSVSNVPEDGLMPVRRILMLIWECSTPDMISQVGPNSTSFSSSVGMQCKENDGEKDKVSCISTLDRLLVK